MRVHHFARADAGLQYELHAGPTASVAAPNGTYTALDQCTSKLLLSEIVTLRS
eukprot:COSAG02_NODE_795_length_17133_cov_6.577727_8_plen_53_part_00